MEQIKIKDINLFKGFDGTLQMSILIDGQFTAKAQNAVENAKERLINGKDVGIVVDRLKKHRSLDANAYFHVLCDKIAAALGGTMDEMKTQLVTRYGTPLYAVTIPETANIENFWRYYLWLNTSEGTSTYLLYKQTHTMDSKEMSRLIEGTIDEAKQLGIETATPKEIAEMTAKWEAENGRKDN